MPEDRRSVMPQVIDVDDLSGTHTYRDTLTRPGGSKRHPKSRPTDQCQGMFSQLRRGSDHDLGWHGGDPDSQIRT